MCFEYDSRPPIEPISGAAVDTRRFTLTSRDGTEFLAYYAGGGSPGSPAVVVMPDVRGLYPFYDELAERFAERGYDSVAIDYFGRTAGTGERGEDFEFMPHVEQTKADKISEDVGAAVEYLRSGQGNADRPVFTVGFCFGGSNSWLQAANGHGLSGAIGFYGRPTSKARDGSEAPIERVSEMRAPLLALMGGADQGIPVEEVEKFDKALSDAGVEHEVKIYEGAPHSFFDRHYAQYDEASQDAWQRVLDFIQRHS